MRKNSNAYKIYTTFVDGTIFHTHAAASTISTSRYKYINGGSIKAALKALHELSRQGLVQVVEFGPRGGYYGATWQIKQVEE